MTESIMAFYSYNVWSKQHTRQTQRTVHWVLQAIGSCAAIASMITEYVGRENLSKGHFMTTHSKIGLAAGIFTLAGMLNGVSALWSKELKRYLRPVYFKFAHNINGITAFILGKYFNFHMKYSSINSFEASIQV